MAVVTISRQLGSMGNEVAQKLAEELGFELMSKELFSDMLHESGYTDKGGLDNASAEEKPSFLSTFVFNRDRLVDFIKKVVYDFARRDNAIIMGLGGQLLFQSVPNTLRVRIMAPVDVRVKRVMENFACDERTALSVIKESDQARANFNKYFFDIDWDSASLYDLLINTENLSADGALRLVKEEIKHRENEINEGALSRKLEELELVQRVVIGILYQNKLSVPNLKVNMADGAITLDGSTKTVSDRENCATAARMVANGQVVNNIVALPADFRA